MLFYQIHFLLTYKKWYHKTLVPLPVQFTSTSFKLLSASNNHQQPHNKTSNRLINKISGSFLNSTAGATILQDSRFIEDDSHAMGSVLAHRRRYPKFHLFDAMRVCKARKRFLLISFLKHSARSFFLFIFQDVGYWNSFMDRRVPHPRYSDRPPRCQPQPLLPLFSVVSSPSSQHSINPCIHTVLNPSLSISKP